MTSVVPSTSASLPWPGGPGMTADVIERIEEGGIQPAIALLRRLAALDFDVHLTAGQDLGSVWFEPHAA